MSAVATQMATHCKCGAALGRSGKCPALCEPVPQPPPKYDGPAVVGRTHTSRLAAPAYVPPPARYRLGSRVRFMVTGGMIVDGNVTAPGDAYLFIKDDRGMSHKVAAGDVIRVLAV